MQNSSYLVSALGPYILRSSCPLFAQSGRALINGNSKCSLPINSRRHIVQNLTTPTPSPVPLEDEGSEETTMKLDTPLLHHLERTSLVDFSDKEAQRRMEEAVAFASTIFEVDTTGVEPLTSVLENETLHLREDVIQSTSRDDVLVNAAITEEDYFVAPPGNIPLDQLESWKTISKSKRQKIQQDLAFKSSLCTLYSLIVSQNH